MEKEKKIIKWNRFFVHHRIVSSVKRVEFVSDRMSYIVLRGRWCNIVVLNVFALSKEKVIIQKRVFMHNQYWIAVISISTI